MKQIPGIIFRPCSLSVEEYEAKLADTKSWTQSNFYETYSDHIAAMVLVADCAKIYILKNYENVTDWSQLDVTIFSRASGESTSYYNYEATRERRAKLESKLNESSHGKSRISAKSHSSKAVNRLLDRVEATRKLRHNPISTLTDVVLDPTDGDFSLIINEKDHMWIQDEAIIIIAQYIENQLQK